MRKNTFFSFLCFFFFGFIEQATDNSASAGNLALHLRICDAVNDSDTGYIIHVYIYIYVYMYVSSICMQQLCFDSLSGHLAVAYFIV